MGFRKSVSLIIGLAVLGFASGPASADGPAPQAEVRVIKATKCSAKKIDPKIGEPAPPSMGFDCLDLLKKETMSLTPSGSMGLPDGRVFKLTHAGKTGNRHKMNGAINQADGTLSHNLGTINAD